MDMLAPRWLYRASQFHKALGEGRSSASNEFIQSHLDARGAALFRQMTTRDQAHAAKTAAFVSARTDTAEDLVVAALLHDIGKGRQSIRQRVLYVVLASLSPGLLARLARPGAGTRGALYRSLNHPSIGAGLAAAAGCSTRICDLIAAHHEPPGSPELVLLRWADEVA
jgi:putative nucleotidyltransferase with HDIG domain